MILACKQQVVNAQTLLSPDFASWPPQGWGIENQNANWSAEFSVQAGGQPPEARLSGSPIFFNTTRLISPVINLNGITTLSLSFNSMADVVSAGFTLGVATRNGNTAWQTIWSTSLYASTSCFSGNIPINNSNTNQADFQFCFYFLGNSANLNAWYLDDVKLFIPPLHDIAAVAFLSPEQYAANTPIIPVFSLKNIGLSNEVAVSVNCQVLDSGNAIIYNQSQLLQNFAAGTLDTVSFPAYLLPQSNCVYKVRMNVTQPGDLNPSNDSVSGFVNTFEMISRKFVLLELGTVTWCPHCPPAAVTVENMLNSGDKLAVICYHGAYGDPFNSILADNRLAYYNIQGFPTAEFDGVISHSGSSISNTLYPGYYQQRLNLKTPFDLQLYGSIVNNNGSIHVIIRKAAPIVNPRLVLRVFLTESSIPFVWQTQTQIQHLARMMISGNSGVIVDLVNNSLVNIPLDFTKSASWINNNCEIIAFVQDSVTKEVFQTQKLGLNSLTPLTLQTINGFVRYDNLANTPLSGIVVKLMQGPFVIASTTSDASGYYSFPDVIPGKYSLRCSANKVWGGANSIDALLILKQYAGLSSLSPLRVTACDIDGAGNINSMDALALSRRFVGLANSFPKGDWVFDSPTVYVTATEDAIVMIKGICRGDVNGSYIPY
ncbi:MAG: carboxypeptidase regulatory-like domain-containing protein [Bacteroidota bacterium]